MLGVAPGREMKAVAAVRRRNKVGALIARLVAHARLTRTTFSGSNVADLAVWHPYAQTPP